MKTFAVVALVAALVVPASAGAAKRETDSDLALRSGIPTPRVEIIREACPAPPSGGIDTTMCAYPDGRVYMPVADETPFFRQHELAHVFDVQFLSVGEQSRATVLLGMKRGTPWDNGTGSGGFDSPKELLADGYAACRLGLDPESNWETAYDYSPTRRELRLLCGFLHRAAL